MSSWIKMLPVQNASGELKEAYEIATTPSGTIDNVMRIHSQRPHTMLGHIELYRSVLHNKKNTMPVWFLEAIGVFTSLLNDCDYSVTHHIENMRRLLNDEKKAYDIESSLRDRAPEKSFSGKELALMKYVHKLTLNPGEMIEADVLQA